MVISVTGTPKRCKGCTNRAPPSIRDVGGVVAVIIIVPEQSAIRRATISSVAKIPSRGIWCKKPRSESGSPPDKTRFENDAIKTRIIIGLSPRNTSRKALPEIIRVLTAREINTKNEAGLFTIKRATIRRNIIRSLLRGSARCRRELPSRKRPAANVFIIYVHHGWRQASARVVSRTLNGIMVLLYYIAYCIAFPTNCRQKFFCNRYIIAPNKMEQHRIYRALMPVEASFWWQSTEYSCIKLKPSGDDSFQPGQNRRSALNG